MRPTAAATPWIRLFATRKKLFQEGSGVRGVRLRPWPWSAACPDEIFCQNITASLCHTAAKALASCPLAIQMTEVQEGGEGLKRGQAGVGRVSSALQFQQQELCSLEDVAPQQTAKCQGGCLQGFDEP